MTNDQPGGAVAADPSVNTAPNPPGPGPRRRWVWAALAGLAVAAGVGFYAFSGRQREAKAGQGASAGHAAAGEGPPPGKAGEGSGEETRVEVATPKPGGLERTSEMPGSLHAFDYADLYAKVSGYLKVQKVDIGDKVKEGDVLIEIDDPEVHTAVDQAKAALDQARAKVQVAEAMIKTAEANAKAAAAMVTVSEVDVKTKETNRVLQKKQLTRITGLVQRNAVEAKLEDEQQDRYDVALSEESGAKAAVIKAQADLIAKNALIEESRADLAEAKAKAGVAAADLATAKVWADYTVIKSPYTGVVTKRNFHVGDFIRDASGGQQAPLLSVARTDLIRVVVPVADRDVAFVEVGDKAVVRMDALNGKVYHGQVDRFSHSEESESRNMRTEVDIPNADGKLRDGMWGRVTILLEPPSPHCVNVPAASILDRNLAGEGFVYVVRGGKVHKLAVRIGKDDGARAEVLDGLTTNDQVVVRYTGQIEEGAAVNAVVAAREEKPEH